MRILAVDDSSSVRKYIKSAIDLLGFEFLEAENGKDGLGVVESYGGEIALIILDKYMPVMGGLALLDAFQSNENYKHYKHIPISMVTVEAERGEIQKAVDIGAANYLVKPFEREELFSKIIDAVGMEKIADQDFSFSL